MSRRTLSYISTGILLILVVILALHDAKNSTPPNAQQAMAPRYSTAIGSLGSRTKTTECGVQGALPDSACTPGAIIPSATTDKICRSGYASSVRNVPSATKTQVYREYGIASHAAGEYEVDHLVSLELGGSNDIANLWPEAAEPTPGFHEKDAVENYLHNQVCSGKMTLSTAQQNIASNWLAVYKAMQ